MGIDTYIPVSFGELIDKITILEIKLANISHESRLINIRNELSLLGSIRDNAEISSTIDISSLTEELKSINQRIWDAEDVIHGPDQHTLSNEIFLHHAKIAFSQNDLRAQAKRKINDIVGSFIVEEKSYPGFG